MTSVASLLGDECARTILEATVSGPKSAEALGERCEASMPTVYRRLEALEEHDLVEVRRRPDDEGHHYKMYSAALDRAVFDLGPDGLELRLARRDRMADRFTKLIDEMR